MDLLTFRLLLQILLLILIPASQANDPGCPTHCGNVSIPYPFGLIGHPTCYRDRSFAVSCNASFNPPKIFLNASGIEVLEILLDRQLMRIVGNVASVCLSRQATNSTPPSASLISFDDDGPFAYSSVFNKFTAIGCDVMVTIRGSYRRDRSRKTFTSRCVLLCGKDGGSSCSSLGCCQVTIPKGLRRVDVEVERFGNGSDLRKSPRICGSAFLIEQHEFAAAGADFSEFLDRRGEVEVAVDWAIGNQTCQAAGKNECGRNSLCSASNTGIGFACACEPGFQGNPYLAEGCQDINECEDPSINPCTDICKNTPGSYCCSCPFGTVGDGRKLGSGCTPILADPDSRSHVLRISLGICLGLFFLLVGSVSFYWVLRRRKLVKLREKFFKQNGGLLLKQKNSSHGNETTKIFTTEELMRATDNYAEDRILGRGGYGTVYKGVLLDQRTVAIKKSRTVDESQVETFINEVAILSQVNHRNVVKLIGCCLETQVPLLVYEFIPNGTLFHHIHEQRHASPISWENRLRIAAETAEALAYLHSAASTPIIHRDIKSANILLDYNYTAKVSDFGASRSVPFDQTHVTTLVQGSLGYLDPEYFQTSQLTDKSDVYSFGVVLLELLTGEMPVSYSRAEAERNLVAYFLSQEKETHLLQILDARVADEGQIEQIQEVVKLAKRCVRLKGEERPAMKEVAAELEGLRRLQDHPWLQKEQEEIESLLSGPSECYEEDAPRKCSL